RGDAEVDPAPEGRALGNKAADARLARQARADEFHRQLAISSTGASVAVLPRDRTPAWTSVPHRRSCGYAKGRRVSALARQRSQVGGQSCRDWAMAAVLVCLTRPS